MVMFNGRMSAGSPVWRPSSPPPSLRWKASRVTSFPTGWARPRTYGINIIITLPFQRDCPAPSPSALIGQTAGNQDRTHRGITQEASGAASHSRWMTRSQRLPACNSALFGTLTSGLAPRGTVDGLGASRPAGTATAPAEVTLSPTIQEHGIIGLNWEEYRPCCTLTSHVKLAPQDQRM